MSPKERLLFFRPLMSQSRIDYCIHYFGKFGNRCWLCGWRFAICFSVFFLQRCFNLGGPHQRCIFSTSNLKKIQKFNNQISGKLIKKAVQFHQNRHRSSLVSTIRAYEAEARLVLERIDKLHFGIIVIICLLAFGLYLDVILGLVLCSGFVGFFLARLFLKDKLQQTNHHATTARAQHLILYQLMLDNALALKFGDRASRMMF